MPRLARGQPLSFIRPELRYEETNQNKEISVCHCNMNERACLSHVHQKKHRLFGSPSCSDRGKTKKRSQKISFLCNFKHLPHVQAYLGPSNTSVDFVSLFCCLFLAPSIFGPIFRSSSGRDIWNAACLLSPFPKFNKATQMFKCLVDTTP